MSSGSDNDRHREHLGVSQTKQAKKKKSRRPIDPKDIEGSISSVPERINHDTHLFVVPFGIADPWQYYPNYRTPSPIGTSPQLSAMRLGDSSSEQSDAMASTPLLTQRFVHPDVSLSWHPANDAAWALKDYVRRLYTHIPNSIRQTMFNNFKTMCTWESRYNLVIGTTFKKKESVRLSSWLKKVRDSGERPSWMLPHYWNTDKFKAISDQAKMARDSLKGGSKKLGCTLIEPEVFKKTHVRKKENESDPNVWAEEKAERTFGICYGLGSRNDARRLQSGLEGIGSSRQAEALDEQVMNLVRQPTTSAFDDIDDESDEDDYVDLTP
ncbi:hypothetical protein H5410_026595 [Solanum commersonii]|uniref:Uncharacterized protein n=1 Tax=Solanum commersonii TaxID=4109 RepID=A0A9J5YZG4_SOLCO|nr:hypothetical protein H5410_026595 [Solanum commersonii]